MGTASRQIKDELLSVSPEFDLCQFWAGIESGVGDQYESKILKEGAWRRIKVKIDTLVGDRTVGSISLLQPS